ncbi:unnamed protein product, partial [Heterosigma akashiwo]
IYFRVLIFYFIIITSTPSHHHPPQNATEPIPPLNDEKEKKNKNIYWGGGVVSSRVGGIYKTQWGPLQNINQAQLKVSLHFSCPLWLTPTNMRKKAVNQFANTTILPPCIIIIIIPLLSAKPVHPLDAT